MTLGRLAGGLALAILLGAGARLPAADDKPADGDLKKIQGKWTAPAGDGGKVTYTFDGHKLKVGAPSRAYTMTVTLDSEAKPDRTIDLRIDEGPEDAKGKTSKGIYKFDGEKFVFCFRPEGDRPSKFETVGYEQIVVELSRAKD
jgi:uncharacterized protein (TIGR03067 family)